MTVGARILVATEGIADADMMQKLLCGEFDNIAVSTNPERAVEDFEQCRPAVLVLAFNTLEKAERYYLGLYRLSTLIHELPHRTLILCNKDDLLHVYELCKKEYFDDYVLFWTLTHDATRLHMALHHALRQMAGAGDSAPTVGEFAVLARRLAEVESLLEQHAVKGGQHVEVASRLLRQAEQDIGTALDGFSRGLSEGSRPDLVEVRDQAGFQQAFDHLKREEIEKSFQSVATAVQPVRQWAGTLKEDLAPHLESARALQVLAERVRPVVLVVEDDEFQHKLLERLLADENLELTFATTGTDALTSLRKHRPDLVLMDVNLPDINGVELTRRIKAIEQFASIPVVMITGHSEKSVVLESKIAGASDFVAKPFIKNNLLAKVRKYLNGGSSL